MFLGVASTDLKNSESAAVYLFGLPIFSSLLYFTFLSKAIDKDAIVFLHYILHLLEKIFLFLAVPILAIGLYNYNSEDLSKPLDADSIIVLGSFYLNKLLKHAFKKGFINNNISYYGTRKLLRNLDIVDRDKTYTIQLKGNKNAPKGIAIFIGSLIVYLLIPISLFIIGLVLAAYEIESKSPFLKTHTNSCLTS